MVSITGEDGRFNELAILFSEYWQEASVLTEEVLKKYKNLYLSHSKIDQEISSLAKTVNQDIGNVVFHNIGREKRKVSKENIFLEAIERSIKRM